MFKRRGMTIVGKCNVVEDSRELLFRVSRQQCPKLSRISPETENGTVYDVNDDMLDYDTFGDLKPLIRILSFRRACNVSCSMLFQVC